jgi:hypothetical protein
MRGIYEDTVKHAKQVFDPARARSDEAKDIASDAAAQAKQGERPAEAGPRPSVDELAGRLADLEELRARGAISEADFRRRKDEILDEV